MTYLLFTYFQDNFSHSTWTPTVSCHKDILSPHSQLNLNRRFLQLLLTEQWLLLFRLEVAIFNNLWEGCLSYFWYLINSVKKTGQKWSISRVEIFQDILNTEQVFWYYRLFSDKVAISGSSGLSVLFGIAQYQRIADEVKNLKALLS